MCDVCKNQAERIGRGRARRMRRVLANTYTFALRTPNVAVVDLLTDLNHYAERAGVDFYRALEDARYRYVSERPA